MNSTASVSTSSTSVPRLVVCFAGKRKSGKDYISNRLLAMLRNRRIQAEIRGVSFPLKEEYARLHGNELDIEKLKSDGDYKEKYRKDMVEFGERIRNQDPGYFCRKTMEMISSNTQVVLISDCRRPTDIAYFRENYSTLTVRIHAPIEIRLKRGFVFTSGIDDAETECALDEFQIWDLVLENGEIQEEVEEQLQKLVDEMKSRIDR